MLLCKDISGLAILLHILVHKLIAACDVGGGPRHESRIVSFDAPLLLLFLVPSSWWEEASLLEQAVLRWREAGGTRQSIETGLHKLVGVEASLVIWVLIRSRPRSGCDLNLTVAQLVQTAHVLGFVPK